MQQHRRFKQQHPKCVLFFRMGDFYELFYDDAKLAHKVLGVALTQRTAGIPMAGVPYHAVDGYLQRMIQAGHRVAVCDQVEDPKFAKGVVKRDVTRIITPGTLTDEALLEEGQENPLAAVAFHDEQRAALAWVELSTGVFQVGDFAADTLKDELARIAPRELLYVEASQGNADPRVQSLLDTVACASEARPAWHFRQAEAVETLQRQFQVKTLEGFGFGANDPTLGPASGIIHYLLETQKTNQQAETTRIAHLQPPRHFSQAEHLIIDQVSLYSLEVEHTIRSGQTDNSLLGVLQDCRTAMGKRMLRQWLCYPLRSRDAIEHRQRGVTGLVGDTALLSELRGVLADVQDVARIIARIAVDRATPRDLTALGTSAAQGGTLAGVLDAPPALASYRDRLLKIAGPLAELASAIAAACVEAPPAHLREGGVIRDGHDQQLDECRSLQRDHNDWLARYQKQLVDETGIANLKVGYNKIFGFYIELSAANRDRAPDNWTRKQTLKNAERFITSQLKSYEANVLTAQQRGIAREQELFAQLCHQAQDYLHHLHAFGQIVAELDVLACFGQRAVRHRYVRPDIVDEPVLSIQAGRHPVLDDLLRDRFVPNDVHLGWPSGAEPSDEPANDLSIRPATLALITGPNMAGKSTYIRQTALIVLMAQTGSFVPAEAATIGLCDRIFTRIGASDELHTGQSTFMVEMTEAANICHHATAHSLVILDEIGRGTSTLDGLSLAWAIAEHLAKRQCRTLLATHYHELTALSEQYENVANLNVTVREWKEEIAFLHRIVPGATDRSYGIHVAKIAGLPNAVVERANQLLAQLEVSHRTPVADLGGGKRTAPPANPQLSLFTEYLTHPAIEQLRKVDLNALSPLEAFDQLRRLQQSLDSSPSTSDPD